MKIYEDQIPLIDQGVTPIEILKGGKPLNVVKHENCIYPNLMVSVDNEVSEVEGCLIRAVKSNQTLSKPFEFVGAEEINGNILRFYALKKSKIYGKYNEKINTSI